ncbi:MAG: type IV secretion system DNA-binding domain-containing protein [Candidatus Pacebacteria bacterium]|nr:type IV secretion system DNA-binding domain-containing protein [Candidatus Paceibacterota bacterium]
MSDFPEVSFNKELTYLGITTYRDKNTLFGIKRKDRRQHVYILGKSGTGKSVLMFNMIIQNIQNGEGVCLVDPHGENVEGVLSAIPPHRMKDVIYFNPADADYHIGFNVLELVDPQYKHLVASGLMGIFTKIWANAWSARMEYILNNCILALLDTPNTTLLGIPRMLVDKDYRQKIITNLKDPVIKAFWVHEYEAWQDKFRNEAIAPIQNKVGQFLSTSIIRNVVGQQKSTINIFDMMNEGKIFLVNVSKGRIGEDNSALLGGMIITKIQLAAMERVRIPEETRRDFYLYVDEFQNFVTDAFASILSEARKYRLNLTVAHQYTAQLISDKSSAVRDAIFGNVGTIIVFRVGADDAAFLESEFEPEFIPQDIVNLPNYKIYLKLMIDGVTSRPFSAKTLPQMMKSGNLEVEQEVIRTSRELYCKPREVVEREIYEWSGMSLGDITPGTSATSNNSSGGPLEKFPIICSMCGLEKSVPFKPEKGRPAYCKECIAKIKSGEVKVEKSSENQIKYDDSKYFKPLADLGIEFEQVKQAGDDRSGFAKKDEKERYPQRNDSSHHMVGLPNKTDKSVPQMGPRHAVAEKPGIMNSIKKIFQQEPAKNEARPNPLHVKRVDNIKASVPQENRSNPLNVQVQRPAPRVAQPNMALKDALSKINIPVAPEPKAPEPAPVPASAPKAVEPLSLDALKQKTKESVVVSSSKDRAATAEDMNKLKDLIIERTEVKPASTPAPAPTPAPEKSGTMPPLTTGNVKEVPEDVLKKLLE